MGNNRLANHMMGPALVLIALVFLDTCHLISPEPIPSEESARAVGRYAFDPASGVTRASVTAADGSVTRLASGTDIPITLPPGFTQFPGSEAVENVRVEAGEGSRILLTMTSDRPLTEIAAHYRAEAEEAGIAIDVDIASDGAITLAGRAADGGRFSLHARREGEGTRAQLSVER